MATYNGHKNWNHWNVSLWIGNDPGLYQMAQAAIRGWHTKDEAARAMLTELPPTTPDVAPYTFTTIRAALRGM
jgi:uncharacterized protein (UPF0548 family)